MANNHNFSFETIPGGFQLIRIHCNDSNFVTLFGIYWGGYEGRLYLPPQSYLTTQYISEVNEELTRLYPGSNWVVKINTSYPAYKELVEIFKEMFESAGIAVEIS